MTGAHVLSRDRDARPPPSPCVPCLEFTSPLATGSKLADRFKSWTRSNRNKNAACSRRWLDVSFRPEAATLALIRYRMNRPGRFSATCAKMRNCPCGRVYAGPAQTEHACAAFGDVQVPLLVAGTELSV